MSVMVAYLNVSRKIQVNSWCQKHRFDAVATAGDAVVVKPVLYVQSDGYSMIKLARGGTN
jgi:hypothetical protein